MRQGCQIIFAAYGQNPDKNGQNGCFQKKLQPKSQKFLTIVISVFIGVSICSEISIFFAEKCGFAKEASFYPKNNNFWRKLKITYQVQLVFIYLNKTQKHYCRYMHASFLTDFCVKQFQFGINFPIQRQGQNSLIFCFKYMNKS